MHPYMSIQYDIKFFTISLILILISSSHSHGLSKFRRRTVQSSKLIHWNNNSFQFRKLFKLNSSIPTQEQVENIPYKYENKNENFLIRNNQIFKSVSENELNNCIMSKRFMTKNEELLSSGNKNKNLIYFYQYWKRRYQNCDFQKRVSNNNTNVENKNEKKYPLIPESDRYALLATVIVGLFTTFLWLSLVAITTTKIQPIPKPRSMERKKIIQKLHIYESDLNEEESSEEKKSKEEESDKKRAAVKIGLAREIVAINAESIHLAAHILEFLFIVTKIARVFETRGIPNIIRAPSNGQLLSPKQAHEFLQNLELNYNTTKLLSGISGGLKNPLEFLGNKNIPASNIFKNVINNPIAGSALKKLLIKFETKTNNNNSTTTTIFNTTTTTTTENHTNLFTEPNLTTSTPNLPF